MSDNLKKLTGKNKNDYEQVAKSLVDNCDVELFKELVEQDGFLFDFIKQNVAQRIYDACNEKNYRNLLSFLKYYSPSYDEAIVSVLAKYADEDLTDEMLEIFENGDENEKCYCAKFFSYIQDSLALDLLRENSYTENESLNANCAATLGILNDKLSYDNAIEKLNSEDEFEKLNAVKFLVMYGNIEALDKIIDTMKNSTMSENIAGYVPYLINIQELLQTNYTGGLLVVNNIVNGLGEILGLYEVINFELYNIFEAMISNPQTGGSAAVLLNAEDKFNTLTENDEYMFDEDKNTQAEIKDIKKLLNRIDKKQLKALIKDELSENSPFVYTALDYSDNIEAIKELLRCDNQTIILKTAEVLKKLGALNDTERTVALLKITDENIKSILRAL
ncbi:MAG: hypothetical protein VZR09_07560 [Candidatus Gastranaerophilaceae bacterium]|nr:hypothetical protein [Candidatus Gastranaerophilaceae bacterium]